MNDEELKKQFWKDFALNEEDSEEALNNLIASAKAEGKREGVDNMNKKGSE